jgi:chemotaxis methyl-accepting protein methylase
MQTGTRTMPEINSSLKPILDYLMEKRGFDFSGYHPAMLARRIGNRLTDLNCKDFNDYLVHVKDNPAEIDLLLDVITINVSRFFRDTLTFELMADRILPAMVLEKAHQSDASLRIWSAGCAMGEEPYSVAILIHELLRKEGLMMNLHIFATDIDEKILKGAKKAVYPLSSIENIKYRLLTRYFTPAEDCFRLVPEIRNQVSFSLYDILEKKHMVPPESIFGNFDLVLCRNLLIYFNTGYQDILFAKLHHSLAPNGILILGEAEAPTLKYQHSFSRITDFGPIYRKKQKKVTP